MGAASSSHVGITIPSTITNGELTIQDEIWGPSQEQSFPKGAGPRSPCWSYAGVSLKAKLCSHRRHGRSSRLSKATQIIASNDGSSMASHWVCSIGQSKASVSSSYSSSYETTSSELDQLTSQGDFTSALWNRARKKMAASLRVHR
jgi:hypothetical protein